MPSPKIVVATDFSPRADRAIDRALQLCQQHGLGLKAIHALDHIDADKADWGYLEERMSRTVGETSCPTEFEFPEGSPPRAIARAAQSDDTYMLLLGPARYNTLGDFFLGTAVDFILRQTECPTLVVKHRARAPYGHIVVGTDFSPASAHAIIEAARLFPDTRIHVVHAWHVPFAGFQRDEYVRDEVEAGEAKRLDAFMAELVQRSPKLGNATSRLVQGGTHEAFAREISAHGRDPSATLVVLGSHGTSGFRQATLGSVTSELLRTLDADVLVINTRNAEG
ncbi:universal stress protein [Altererythrobacter arenosus]|uniref:Universal stress protein n=1 Tax=Altererythrobacter arenosus TaxID=3032592 RepID=A0ABY8FQL4_9SPHN|nr:universal stress protein [Altererythrobacter sp. CAU 1644]WFL77303.1 universal stress protein [Altererythrobacter sp. CAU 1644]